ncbi:MAG: hypothetical protein ACKOQ4_16380 [Mycobacterium sp.]
MARMLLTVLVTALALAAPASAVPDCTDTAPNTRTCVTPGHTAITTTPNPAFTNPYPWGFGLGTPVFGLGGRGIWIGF